MELDNARAALAHLKQAEMPDLELAMASVMMPAVLNAERLALAQRCEQLIEACSAAGRLPPPVRLYRAWREISVSLPNTRPQRSLAAAWQALALAWQLVATQADRYALYDALCAAAHMVVEDDGAAAAQRLLQEARAIEDPNWPPLRLLPGLRVQASIATTRGEVDEALRLYRRLLDVGRAAGDTGLSTLLNIANAELASGDAAAAVASGTQLVALLEGMRSESLMIFSRVNLAAAHLRVRRRRRGCNCKRLCRRRCGSRCTHGTSTTWLSLRRWRAGSKPQPSSSVPPQRATKRRPTRARSMNCVRISARSTCCAPRGMRQAWRRSACEAGP